MRPPVTRRGKGVGVASNTGAVPSTTGVGVTVFVGAAVSAGAATGAAGVAVGAGDGVGALLVSVFTGAGEGAVAPCLPLLALAVDVRDFIVVVCNDEKRTTYLYNTKHKIAYQ
jgi:hypothetical protein